MKNRLKILLNYIIYLFSLFIPQSKKVFIFGGWTGTRFIDNSRHLFLYIHHNCTDIKAIWITESNDIYKELKEKGYHVYKKWDVFSIYYHLRSYFHFIDQDFKDINGLFSVRAKKINLWHGFPLKKIEKYIEGKYPKKSRKYDILKTPGFWKDQFLFSTSELSYNTLKYAFDKDDNRMLKGVYPRNLVFNSNSNIRFFNSEEENYRRVEKEKNQGKRIIFYLPTFRDKSKLKFLGTENVKEINGLLEFLEKNNYILVTKLHFQEQKKQSINYDKLINLDPRNDIYSFLTLTDILITDYSSVYFDYLHMNKKIIFYPYDLDEYIKNDRGIIFDYNKMTPGNKVFSLGELKEEILNENSEYEYFIKRKKILDLVYFERDISKTINRIKKL